jgi:hypothetical protein
LYISINPSTIVLTERAIVALAKYGISGSGEDEVRKNNKPTIVT